MISVKCLLWSLARSISDCFLLEPSCRGKGFGTEAVLMMMSYGKEVGADKVGSGQAWVRVSPCWE